MTLLTFGQYLSQSDDSRAWLYKNTWVSEVAEIAGKFGRALGGASVLEVGAGVHNPLGCAIIALGRGAARSIAVEPGRLEADHLTHAAMAGLLTSFKYGERNLPFVRALNLILASEGTTEGPDVASDEIRLHRGSIETFCGENAFDLIHSISVLEHVERFPETCRTLLALTAPGGVHVHKVDFVDHRYYETESPTNLDAHRFLLSGQEDVQLDCNRFRMGEIIALFEQSGFVSLGPQKQWQVPFPESAKPLLQPKFRDCSDDDLNTSCAILAFRKPE